MAAAVPETDKVTYAFLGRSGLKVSNICLGCMTFGASSWGIPGQCDEGLSHEIISRYVEWGGNFLDTADIYGLGLSEQIVGRWLERQERDKFVIATKCRGDMGQGVNSIGLSRRHITQSIDGSLERLHTNFVDLYQTHMFDNATPLEETLRTLDDLIRVGKVRYVGVSNVTGWQLQKVVGVTERLGLNPIISLQQQYSLIHRESELEPFQVCKSSGIGVLPWSPLKGGILSGKFSRGEDPTEGRTVFMMKYTPFLVDLSDRTFNILDVARTIARSHGRSIPQVAIRWLLQKDVVPSVIIGARTLAQLDDNIGAANGWALTQEEMQELDKVSSTKLRYPYEGIFRSNTDRANPNITDFYVRSVV